jgi:D-alanyl-D-alanine carboxypeptidase/D-alanyl-D-alanine-endopeptidase (penicillin-binding protein 4)
MDRRVVLGGLLAVAFALGGCGGSRAPRLPSGDASTTSSSSSRHAPMTAGVGQPPATSTVSPAPPLPPGILAFQRKLAAQLRHAGPQVGAFVYDLTAHQPLFALHAGVKRPPASVEKIYTTVAVLQRIGSSTELETTVLGAGHLGPAGVWHGDLYLRGGGDPTLGDDGFNRVWNGGYGPTATDLASQLAAHGIRKVTGQIIGDESLFDSARGGPATHMAPDLPDFGGELGALTFDHGSTSGRLSPGAFAARQLARTMRARKIRAHASAKTGLTPPDAVRLATVLSPPMSTLLRLMDVPSDDLFAEMLTKQLGVRFGAGGTIASGAQVIGGVITGYGLHPAIVDGSGLSRQDRSSPAEVVGLLRAVHASPVGDMLGASLPVVGVNGTVQALGRRTPAQGNCSAKTGTLDGVTNLAGYCRARNHHVLAFAVFLDGPSNWQSFVVLGRAVATIAGLNK